MTYTRIYTEKYIGIQHYVSINKWPTHSSGAHMEFIIPSELSIASLPILSMSPFTVYLSMSATCTHLFLHQITKKS